MEEPGTWPGGDEELDRIFGALAHPARRSILARLAEGPASATELGAPLAMSQPAVSKHLKVLQRAGLIARGRDAQWRPSQLRPEALREVDRWLDGFRRTWERRLDRLDAYLAETGRAEPASGADQRPRDDRRRHDGEHPHDDHRPQRARPEEGT